jgi:hypothetical protein
VNGMIRGKSSSAPNSGNVRDWMRPLGIEIAIARVDKAALFNAAEQRDSTTTPDAEEIAILRVDSDCGATSNARKFLLISPGCLHLQ